MTAALVSTVVPAMTVLYNKECASARGRAFNPWFTKFVHLGESAP
jgi:hypothetical protein